MDHYLGIDIGGSKCAVILAEQESCVGEVPETSRPKPRIISKEKVPTRDEQSAKAQSAGTVSTPSETISGLLALARSMLEREGLTFADIRAVGVSCGGPLDAERGIILSPPNLPGWEEVSITATIKQETGRPAYLQNDANAGALAEWQWGAGRGCKNLIFLTFGTGFGGGIILDGRLYSGTNHMAGEIGHVRLAEYGPAGYGKPGSVEGFCSGGGIGQIAWTEITALMQRGEKPPSWASFETPQELSRSITAKTVCEAAAAGDPLACHILEMSGTYLGRALAILVDILNPERIILGSVYFRCSAYLEPAMRRILEAEALPRALEACSIVPSELGEELGDYAGIGAATTGYNG